MRMLAVKTKAFEAIQNTNVKCEAILDLMSTVAEGTLRRGQEAYCYFQHTVTAQQLSIFI